MTQRDQDEFLLYLRQCTDAQVQGVFDKERSAGRYEYAALAIIDAERRGIEIERTGR